MTQTQKLSQENLTQNEIREAVRNINYTNREDKLFLQAIVKSLKLLEDYSIYRLKNTPIEELL